MEKAIVIGGGCGFWGEAAHATSQLLGESRMDVLIYDYLAEITLSIMARAKAADPDTGYAVDFVSGTMAANLGEIARRGIKVIANAGGLNPQACAAALRKLAGELGVDVRIAVVLGDDLSDRANGLAGTRDMFRGTEYPPVRRIASVNAYLGAFPIAAALSAGADIVVTGRCADSALVLGACIDRFGWAADDFDKLAAGSLAGHLIECGPQATGGNFTDWRLAGNLKDIGYPIAQVEADGAIGIYRPAGTAGHVSAASVCEQMLYEIGDPQAYLLPDVTCDFSQVEMAELPGERVRVTGARGRAPSDSYKVSTTCFDGFRAGQYFQFTGLDARDKAAAFVTMGLERARARLRDRGMADFDEVCVEISGGRPGASALEEVVAKAAVRHQDARAVGMYLKEAIGGALATPPGLHFFTGAGRPKPSPVVKLISHLFPKDAVSVSVLLDGADIGYRAPEVPTGYAPPERPVDPPSPMSRPVSAADLQPCCLHDLAWARSGDKGDSANIGVIARSPDALPWIWAALTDADIRAVFPDEARGEIRKFHLPGTNAINILIADALGGGGVESLRNDPQGKAFAQRLLAMPMLVPQSLLADMRPAQAAGERSRERVEA